MFKYVIKIILAVCIILLPACQLKNASKSNSISSKSKPISNTQEQVKIALLLPLSGKSQKLGRAMSEMAELSLFHTNNNNIKLLMYDTNDDTLMAQNRIKEAINNGAKLIIGPVFSNTTMAVKDIAINNKINLISFSNDPNLTNKGIFILGFSSDAQIKVITAYTMNQGINQFYTLLPATSYGRVVAQILRDIVINNGGNIVKTEFYTHNIAELEIAVESIVTAINNNLNNRQDDSINKQALFIPEGGNQLKAILTLLSKYKLDFDQVQLLGTGQWDDYDTFSISELNGAWFAGSYNKERELLENMFNREYGYRPPRLSILAYDAIALASTLADKKNFSKEALINKNGFIGVDGTFRFNSNGLTERNLAIIKILDQHLEVIEPSSATFID
ncbi:Periplasmic binding component of lipoprotein LppC [Rickettsiales bacterium Ac37b]|nr:Periplasmic binding component of lipoprotein LppC [Rickettsiales bacterium Ac37b]